MNMTLPATPAETAFGGFSLPHRRLEDWRWTDLRQLFDQAYPPSRGGSASPQAIAAFEKADILAPFARTRIILVDGRLATGELAPGIEIMQKAPASRVRGAHEDPLAQLNDRFCQSSLRITVKHNIADPILLTFINTGLEPATSFTRVELVVEKGASAMLLETHIGGDGAYATNSLVEADVAEDARLDRVKIAEDGLAGLHLASFHARLGARATLRDFTMTQGARATRQQCFITFAGERADAMVAGTYLLSGSQHADTKLIVDHAVANCKSRELFKCVMDDHARGIFQGKVVVRPDAQKTDGKQSSNALLLSETAEFDAKPELEIFADDVVCGHGATSGSIDEDNLFYLRARGIPEAEAKSLLIAAFAGEAFDEVAHEGLREALVGLTESWLLKRKGR